MSFSKIKSYRFGKILIIQTYCMKNIGVRKDCLSVLSLVPSHELTSKKWVVFYFILFRGGGGLCFTWHDILNQKPEN